MEWAILPGLFLVGVVGMVAFRRKKTQKTQMDYLVDALMPMAKSVGPVLRLHRYEGSVAETLATYLHLTRGIQPENFSAKELHRDLQRTDLFPRMSIRSVQYLLDHHLPVVRRVPACAKTPRQRRRMARYSVLVF